MWMSIWLIAAQVSLVAAYSSFQPMVAFKCGKPAMHMTKHGWQQDPKTDCLRDPVDVLKYCRKIYKHLEITNALESGHEVIIDNWCTKDTKHCKSADLETVRPVRCVVGTFHSDALLVPDGCSFEHEHDERQCRTPQQLHAVAKQRCAVAGADLHLYEWLLPCGVDLLTGVEFVCCPTAKGLRKLDKEYAQNEVNPVSEEEFVKNDVLAARPKHHKVVPKKGVAWDQYWDEGPHEKKPVSGKGGKADDFDRYVNGRPMKSFFNEHDRFRGAKTEWEDGYHEKVTKLMKDWSDAREKVHAMRHKDPKGAAKLDQTIQERFRKLYDALKAEGDQGREQLDRVHQDRVRKQMAEKKKAAFDRFLDALAEPRQDAEQITATLRHYIKLEEKDKLHTLNRHQHITDMRTDAAAVESSLMPKHIKEVNMRIEQSLEFVKAKVQQKDLQQEILTATQKYIDSFVDLDRSIDNAIFTEKSVAKKTEAVKPEVVEPKKDLNEKPAMKSDDDEDDTEGGAGAVVYEKEWDGKQTAWKSGKWNKDEEGEDERTYKSNVANDQASLEQGLDSGVAAASSSSHAGAITGAVVVGALLVLAAALVVRRYRARRRRAASVTHTFVEPSPEEQHVASMQAKGYENPTYKYFETQAVA